MAFNKTKIPSVQLNSGYKLPQVGLGTSKADKDEMAAALNYAVECGYRHIDTAWYYGNEKVLGDVIWKNIKEGKLTREEMFITTKLSFENHNPKEVEGSLKKSLEAFNTNYLDLYLIHFPAGTLENAQSSTGLQYTDHDYVDTWKALEKLQEKGLIRSIGVSNFNEYQLKRILKEATIVPAVNQIETHPYLTEDKLIKFCQEKSITVIAHTPLGCKGYIYRKLEKNVLEDEELKRIASKLKKTVAQVMLRFQLQRGVCVIPKSVTPHRIKSNMEVFDFQLSEEDMITISSLNENFRVSNWVLPGFDISRHKYYPFRENYSE